MCKCVDIFGGWGMNSYVCSISLFLSFWIRGYLFFLSFLTCLSMWHTFFGYASFIFFLHSPHILDIFLRESGVIHGHGVFILWMDVYLLTYSVEA